MLAAHSSNDSLASSLARLPAEAKAKILGSLSAEEAAALRYEWGFWARAKQLWPPGEWRTWLILAGRGFGKTRCLVEWCNWRVETGQAKRIHIVAATAADARDVLAEGESGFLSVSPPWLRPEYEPSKRRLTWPNGARATLFSADEPDRLRGPQCDTALADELAAWKYPEAWDQLQFGLRLGKDPRAAVATTPRPTPIIKTLVADPQCITTRGSTFENRANLADAFVQKILARYEGTRLGRQELGGEILDDAPGSLWKREQIEKLRASRLPCELVRLVVAVDPSVGGANAEAKAEAERKSDGSGIPTGAETGIIAGGLGEDGIVYILEDASLIGPTPLEWGTATVATYSKLRADLIVGEVNNGGDLVESNVRAVNPALPFKKIHASRGKQVRAEPVSGRYEQGKIRHVGFFPKLEDQMCQWEPGVSLWSPNRVDALVWLVTELTEGLGLEDDYSVGGYSAGRRL